MISHSLGDTIASLPYIEKFGQVNPDSEIYVSINNSFIFLLEKPSVGSLRRSFYNFVHIKKKVQNGTFLLFTRSVIP